MPVVTLGILFLFRLQYQLLMLARDSQLLQLSCISQLLNVIWEKRFFAIDKRS